MVKFETVVVSDLHLGARNCRTEEFRRLLDTIQTRRLIIAGDLFDSPKLRRLRHQDIHLLESLRAFSQEVDVEWIHGNHDPPAQWCSALLGLDSRLDLELELGERTYLVAHGDACDPPLNWPWALIETADLVYRVSQQLDPSHRLARGLKRGSKHFCKAVEQTCQAALAEVRRRELHGVILGHTHMPHQRRLDSLHYLNCGCWTEKPAGFVGIRDGRARLYSWDRMAQRQQSCGRCTVPQPQTFSLDATEHEYAYPRPAAVSSSRRSLSHGCAAPWVPGRIAAPATL